MKGMGCCGTNPKTNHNALPLDELSIASFSAQGGKQMMCFVQTCHTQRQEL
jgi:hypothetical protein